MKFATSVCGWVMPLFSTCNTYSRKQRDNELEADEQWCRRNIQRKNKKCNWIIFYYTILEFMICIREYEGIGLAKTNKQMSMLLIILMKFLRLFSFPLHCSRFDVCVVYLVVSAKCLAFLSWTKKKKCDAQMQVNATQKLTTRMNYSHSFIYLFNSMAYRSPIQSPAMLSIRCIRLNQFIAKHISRPHRITSVCIVSFSCQQILSINLSKITNEEDFSSNWWFVCNWYCNMKSRPNQIDWNFYVTSSHCLLLPPISKQTDRLISYTFITLFDSAPLPKHNNKNERVGKGNKNRSNFQVIDQIIEMKFILLAFITVAHVSSSATERKLPIIDLLFKNIESQAIICILGSERDAAWAQFQLFPFLTFIRIFFWIYLVFFFSFQQKQW